MTAKGRKELIEEGRATRFSGSTAAEFGRRGGIACAKAKKEKKVMLEALLTALEKKLPDGRTRKQSVIDSLLDQCEEGNVAAINTVLDRVDGKTAPVISEDEDAVAIATVLIAARRRATQ